LELTQITVLVTEVKEFKLSSSGF